MKKILVAFTLILAVALIVPFAAQAATEKETQICNAVKEKENVVDAQCVIYDGRCIIALKTKKFASKTEYDTFKEELRKEVAENFGINQVLITRSPKAMHTIKRFSELAESQRDDALKDFVEHEFDRNERPSIQPKLPA